MKMQKKNKKLSIFLASTSPRRFALLKQCGIEVKVIAPQEVDETPEENEKPNVLVKRLAQAKAFSVLNSLQNKTSPGIILGADTIVLTSSPMKILGKPKTQADAKRMLEILSGKVHWVYTGYCILFFETGFTLSKGVQKKMQVVRSQVRFTSLTQSMIQSYIRSREGMDKAGGYAAQGMGMRFIESIRGSYSNIIGLPLAQVLKDLPLS